MKQTEAPLYCGPLMMILSGAGGPYWQQLQTAGHHAGYYTSIVARRYTSQQFHAELRVGNTVVVTSRRRTLRATLHRLAQHIDDRLDQEPEAFGSDFHARWSRRMKLGVVVLNEHGHAVGDNWTVDGTRGYWRFMITAAAWQATWTDVDLTLLEEKISRAMTICSPVEMRAWASEVRWRHRYSGDDPAGDRIRATLRRAEIRVQGDVHLLAHMRLAELGWMPLEAERWIQRGLMEVFRFLPWIQTGRTEADSVGLRRR